MRKLIALLRERAMVGRMEVRDKQLMLEAADALEHIREVTKMFGKEESDNGSKQNARKAWSDGRFDGGKDD